MGAIGLRPNISKEYAMSDEPSSPGMASAVGGCAPKRYQSLQEVAEAWGVSVRTVRRLIAQGELKAYRIGGQVRIAVDDSARCAVAHPIGQHDVC